MNTKTEELRKLIAEATGGKWRHEPERYSARNVIGLVGDDRWIAHCQPEFNGDGNADLICFLRNNAEHFLELLTACYESADECHQLCASWTSEDDCDCGYVLRCEALAKFERGE